MSFYAGLGLGIGVGLAVGLVLGHILMQVGLSTLQDAIEKVTYSLRYPRSQTAPVQVVLPTENTFDDLEQDDERVPNWMEDDFVMPK